MKTIVLTNQKGGVSKTTTTYALATGLHNKGYSVLCIDLDPQSNLSFTAGYEEAEQTLYDVFKGQAKTADVLTTIKTGLDLLSVGLAATACDLELSGKVAREYMLSEALNGLDYDYCIIDTAPTLNLLTMNALTCADSVIVPLNAEIYSLQGIGQLAGFIENIRKYTNKGLTVSGLLLTKYNDRLNISQALTDSLNQAADVLDTVIYETKIRESVVIKETQLLRGSIYDEAPKANATQDYLLFIDEFLSKEN